MAEYLTVSQILSNFAEVKDGRLVVRCHHNQTWCHMCSKNLCKGMLGLLFSFTNSWFKYV